MDVVIDESILTDVQSDGSSASLQSSPERKAGEYHLINGVYVRIAGAR